MTLHHDLTGPGGAPLIVLGPSLGTSTTVWDRQVPMLARHYRVLRFDLPGHGGSPPVRSTMTVGDLAALVLELTDETFHYAGISLGGAIGAHLAVHHPDRVASLSLVCSSAHFGPPEPWHERAALVRRDGIAPLLATSPARWFADRGGADTPFGRQMLRSLAAVAPADYAACCDALAAYDLRPRIADIIAPTLVVAGARDAATPPHHAAELASSIPNTTLVTIDTGHLAAERPEDLLRVITDHLANAEPADGTGDHRR